VNEAVDRVIEQREAMDRGFPMGVALSGVVHLMLVGVAFGAAWLGPREPLIKVADGIAVPLPRGGGGPVQPEPAPAAAPAVTTPAAPEAPPVEAPAPPPPKVLQPPKEEPRKGLPPPDAKKTKPPKPERSVAPSRRADAPTPERTSGSSRAAVGGTGTNNTTPGLGLIGPAGPGAPNGSDTGDWYLAGVQQKIWVIWTRQIKTNFTQPITISLTILADGSLEDGSVRILQSSGLQLLDNAAQRAVYSGAPFSPLPKAYGTNRITIQAVFQPTP
jgi:TonB family protein